MIYLDLPKWFQCNKIMVVFKQKDFTLAEGHYSGPKDQDKVPGALEVIGKSALGGALAGSAVGAILKDSTALEGAITGGKWGAIAGAAFKFFLNYLHNPMTRVKYQEVDKVIRREFGIFRASGITIGDSVSKRANLDEKFAFNDRKITAYKLTFTVQNDQVTMYTFNLTDKELEKVDSILDYYCKKYTGMEYSSTVLNRRYNAYAAVIVFTNYQVISNFMMELSNALETKINLMDNKALVQGRLSEIKDEEGEEEEKTFSVKDINKFDFAKILGKAACMVPLAIRKPFGEAASHMAMQMMAVTGNKIAGDALVSMGVAMPREAFSNKYLLDTLKKLHYLEDIHYTVGRKDVNANISMLNGRFVVTISKGEDQEKLDKVFWGTYKRLVNRADTGNVVIYTYLINSRKEFEGILNKLFSADILFNIFEG